MNCESESLNLHLWEQKAASVKSLPLPNPEASSLIFQSTSHTRRQTSAWRLYLAIGSNSHHPSHRSNNCQHRLMRGVGEEISHKFLEQVLHRTRVCRWVGVVEQSFSPAAANWITRCVHHCREHSNSEAHFSPGSITFRKARCLYFFPPSPSYCAWRQVHAHQNGKICSQTTAKSRLRLEQIICSDEAKFHKLSL